MFMNIQNLNIISMQHKIITTENYLLVVDDSEIKKCDWYCTFWVNSYGITKSNGSLGDGYEHKKIIAHLPLNNSPMLEGVDLLPPLEDEVEKLAEEWNDKGEFTSPYSFKAGYNKAKEKYKYTEDDLKDIWKYVLDNRVTYKEYLKSLQQLKMPVGFECAKAKEKYMYTAEDVLDAWELGASEGLPLTREKKNNLIKHLQQPKMPVGFLEKGSYNGTWVGEYIY